MQVTVIRQDTLLTASGAAYKLTGIKQILGMTA